MTENIDVKWNDNMSFEVSIHEYKFHIDADKEVGGKGMGPKPKPLLLAALGGCTGMDVISILKKMRVEPEYFNIKVQSEITEEHPKQFSQIHMIYEFKGKDLPVDKLEKAIELSQERYCGVSATLRKAIPLTHEIKIL